MAPPFFCAMTYQTALMRPCGTVENSSMCWACFLLWSDTDLDLVELSSDSSDTILKQSWKSLSLTQPVAESRDGETTHLHVWRSWLLQQCISNSCKTLPHVVTQPLSFFKSTPWQHSQQLPAMGNCPLDFSTKYWILFSLAVLRRWLIRIRWTALYNRHILN